jgi:hypothetical protein
LNLRGTRVSDGAFEVISHLTQLEALDIANTQATDNGLDSLMTLVNLKELSLGRRSESHREIELLRLLPTLTYLAERVYRSGAPGHDIPQAAPVRTDVTDLVRAIRELKDLRVLRLGCSNVDAEGLKALSVLTQVEQLALEACANVNEKGAVALRNSKPGITILGPATAVKTSAGDPR